MKVPATKPYFFDRDIDFIIEKFKDILQILHLILELSLLLGAIVVPLPLNLFFVQ